MPRSFALGEETSVQEAGWFSELVCTLQRKKNSFTLPKNRYEILGLPAVE
jgi:hypothetical protein